LNSSDSPRGWHAATPHQVVAEFQSSFEHGLTTDQARERLTRFGPNELPEPAGRSWLSVFFGQFKSPLISLLLAAAAIAWALGHSSDALVIVCVVLINALIGAIQAGRAERSLRALKRLTQISVRVVRDGQERSLPARECVPGDMLLLEAGDAVAADARLLEAATLQVAEAALTGESLPVEKSIRAVDERTALADRRCMLYAGTHVTTGRARAIVVATGIEAEIGKLAQLAAAAEAPPTPLQRRMEAFGRRLMLVATLLFVSVIAIGAMRGVPLGEIVMIAISQVVGLIPEGLPVALTIALAVGVQRMAQARTIVRRLPAVETLGATTVICTDKTGTLTKNELTVTSLWLPGDRRIDVTGVGYAPTGELRACGESVDPRTDRQLGELLESVLLCNDAELLGATEEGAGWRGLGDPTELSLVTLAVKAGLDPKSLRARFPRRAELPFDSAVKMMATQHGRPQGSAVIIKGAPELVLALCSVEQSEALAAAEAMAAQGLRVLAVTVVDGGTIDSEAGFGSFAGRARLLGLVGQYDPPRLEAAEAVARCHGAGVRVVMLTGDHRSTAQAIAEQLGILRAGDQILDGYELERLTSDQLAQRVAQVAVFARVHPAQKLKIVELLQHRREVVAMTGDGVNDAPALVKADVGVAMGRTGTEVAKESAQVVIGDDDFSTIVEAIEAGRVVYRNIKKALLLLISTSVAEVVVLLLALLAGYPPPFAAVQILWNNLITEGLITVNLAMERAEGNEMRAPPIGADEPWLSRSLIQRMALMVPVISLITLGWYIARIHQGIAPWQVQTETFTLLAICEWFNVLNCRSELRSAFDRTLLRNGWLVAGLIVGNLLQVAVVFWPPLQRIFYTAPIDFSIVVSLGVVGSLVLWTEELRKWIVRRSLQPFPSA
jgi:magnesium-transporting ATPase (P-type)